MSDVDVEVIWYCRTCEGMADQIAKADQVEVKCPYCATKHNRLGEVHIPNEQPCK